LQEAREELHRHGLGWAAVSYDSEAILRDFSEWRRIQYPLLDDRDSDIIRSYGVLDAEATGLTKGMARPGYFYVSPAFAVKEKSLKPHTPTTIPQITCCSSCFRSSLRAMGMMSQHRI
jgi:peroxiredoxin